MASTPRYDGDERTTNRVRTIMDFVMGFIYSGVGIFLLFNEQFGVNVNFPPRAIKIPFAILCLVYGLWRLYRGIKTK